MIAGTIGQYTARAAIQADKLGNVRHFANSRKGMAEREPRNWNRDATTVDRIVIEVSTVAG